MHELSLYFSIIYFSYLKFHCAAAGVRDIDCKRNRNKQENKFLLQFFMPPPMCYYYFLLTGQLSSPLLLLPAPIQSN
jgi:hypothetical protein